MDRLLVLVCTVNERASLPHLMDGLALHVAEADIIVIDDGSTDGTEEWLKEYCAIHSNVRWIQRGRKFGLGSAIKTGLQYGVEKGYDWIINLDADLSHDPAAVPSVLAARKVLRVSTTSGRLGEDQNNSLESYSVADLVIGSRYVAGGGLKGCSWRRHLVSRAANWYARLALGLKVHDCSSAFRCYRAEFLRTIPFEELRCTGYGFLEEILWAIYCRGGNVVETPIVYTEREQGESKISIREAIGTVMTLNRLALRRLTVAKTARNNNNTLGGG